MKTNENNNPLSNFSITTLNTLKPIITSTHKKSSGNPLEYKIISNKNTFKHLNANNTKLNLKSNSITSLNQIFNNNTLTSQINQVNPPITNSHKTSLVNSSSTDLKNLTNINNNLNSTNILTKEKKIKTIAIKRDDKDEYEYSTYKNMQRELMQNIYTKESGEILKVLRKSNESIRSSKIKFIDNLSDKKLDNKISYIEKLDVNENYENENSLKNLNFPLNESCMTSNIFIPIVKKDKRHSEEINSFTNNFKDLKDINLSSNLIQQPEKINYKIKKIKNNSEYNLKTKNSINNFSNYNNFNNSSLNIQNYTNNFQIDEESMYITQSVNAGFPKILGKSSIGNANIEKNKEFSPKINYLNNKLTNNNFNSYNNINNISNPNSMLNNNNFNINKEESSFFQHNKNLLHKNSNNFYCPHCDHCNNIKDENLEKYLNMKEAKNIVKKSLEYIVYNYQTDQSYLDFLLQNNTPNSTNTTNSGNINNSPKGNINNNSSDHNELNKNNPQQKKGNRFDIDVLLNTFPKHNNKSRSVLQIVTHFLDALINDKISLDNIAGPETFQKLKDSLITQGIAFKENEGEIEFDKELDMIFDFETKEKLRKLFKSNFFLSNYFIN